MIISLLKNKFVVIGLFVLTFVFIMVVLIGNKPKNSTPGTQNQSDSSPTRLSFSDQLQVNNVSPASTVLLPTGKPFTFNVFLSTGVNIKNLTVQLSTFNYTQDNRLPIPVAVQTKILENNTLEITTQDPLQPQSAYTLTVTYIPTNRRLVDITYNSGTVSPTPLTQNNQSLIAFLPHETDNYKLSYNKTENIYVFNFKFDASISGPIEDQFQKAKAEALQFIQSKGIDPSSVTVVWKHY